MKMLNCNWHKKVFLIFVVLYIASTASGSHINRAENPLADHLLAKVKEDHWKEDEISCRNDIIRLYEAARNHSLWATWVLDSMQLPVGALYGSRYHLGNFDQCLDQRWSSSNPDLETQYCLVDLTSEEQTTKEFDPYGDAEIFVKSKSLHGRRHYLNSFGVCVPASCSPSSVEKISSHIIRASHLPYGEVSVNSQYCQKAGKQIGVSFGFYVFWFIIISLTAAAATVYVAEDHITDPKLSEIAAWFSPSKNFNTLMKSNSKEVKPLHGIRFISSMLMIVLHYIAVMNTLTIINHTSAGKDAETSVGRFLSHLDITLNSFNVLSGFLFVRGLYNNKNLKPFEVLTKRYKRFIVPFAMIIFYVVSVLPHTGSGPLWPRYLMLEHEPCVKNWWSGLLMMFDSDKYCYVVSWYIACDFQISIIGVIILWCWKKDLKKGLLIFSAALLLSIVIPAIITHWYRLAPVLIYDLDVSFYPRINPVFAKLHIKPYGNLSSYLIGFATGYVTLIYKPEENRKTFSKATSIISSLTIGYIVVKMLIAIGSLLFKEYELINAWYAGFDEVIWALALIGLVIICEYGTLPVVTDFLGCQFSTVCGRLSYGVYLIHMVLIFRNIFSLRAPVTYDIVHWIINGFGYVAVSYTLSYLQWFIIEAPANNMFNYFQRNKQIKTPKS